MARGAWRFSPQVVNCPASQDLCMGCANGRIAKGGPPAVRSLHDIRGVGGSNMLADLRITPIGDERDFPRLVADVVRVIAESRLQYMVHSMGTTIEGELSEILEAVQSCHAELRKHCDRILIELTIDDRSGADGELIRSIEHVREVGIGVPLERLTMTGEY
jgi:uncharacterized protein (TIGR00106 family)